MSDQGQTLNNSFKVHLLPAVRRAVGVASNRTLFGILARHNISVVTRSSKVKCLRDADYQLLLREVGTIDGR